MRQFLLLYPGVVFSGAPDTDNPPWQASFEERRDSVLSAHGVRPLRSCQSDREDFARCAWVEAVQALALLWLSAEPDDAERADRLLQMSSVGCAWHLVGSALQTRFVPKQRSASIRRGIFPF